MDASKKKGLASKMEEKASAPAEATVSPEVRRRPIRTIRFDDCSLSIWSREHMVQGKPTVFLSATIERAYKTRDGAWAYTKSFDVPDGLGKIVELCRQASEYAHDLQNAEQDAQ